MIKNIKIENILDIIVISKSMELNKCNQKNIMKILKKKFPMIFQSLMGLGKSRYDVPSGPPKDVFAHTHEYIYIYI
jgi:hypothetical protein